MSIFGEQNFGVPQPGTVSPTETFQSASNLTTYTLSDVDFGTGGKIIIGMASAPVRTVSSWTADGETVTVRTHLSGTEVFCTIGTADVGTATSGDIVIQFSGECYRIQGLVWDVANVDLTTVSSNPTADQSWNLQFSTIAANGIAVAVAYDQDAGMTGVTNMGDYTESSVQESASMAGASKAFSSAQSNYDMNFDGTKHNDGSGSAGLAVPPS